MRLRIRPVPAAAFVAAAAILNATGGLAGPLSRAAAVFPIIAAVLSALHLAATWHRFGYHEEFSTDHPRKGDVIAYAIHLRNGLPVPASEGICTFASRGPMARGLDPLPISLGPGKAARRESEISCAYRGVYVIGAAAFAFTDALGIFELEFAVEPRTFHVYPELVRLPERADRLAEGGGGERAASFGGSPDPAAFDGLRRVEHGRPAGRIAWKRWAALGVPCELVEGRASAYALRVVLDLRPPRAEGDDRLAAEDLAVTAAYSILARAVAAGIPAQFVLGGDESGTAVETDSDFDAVYEVSTSVLFTDDRFPAAAFNAETACVLVSARPIAEDGAGLGADLFGALEAALGRALPVRVLVVPPPSRADEETARARAAAERLGEKPGAASIAVIDPRKGAEALANAFPF